MKLVTSTGNEIECIYNGNIEDVVFAYQTQDDAFNGINLLTDEELKDVSFVDGGSVVASYNNLSRGEAEVTKEDTGYTCHIHFKEMSALELAIRTLQEEMIEVQEALVEG